MKLGVFGGTFDPIHNAHLFVAEAARTLEGLDRVLFVPTNSVHYRAQAVAQAHDRCEMIAGAIAGNPAFALDRSELEPGATGFTADLLPRLRERYADARLTFILGADSLVNGNWVRLEEILEALERFVVAPRAGISDDVLDRAISAIPPALRPRVATLNLPHLPESASLIRKLINEGKTFRYLVPEPAWRYIIERGLYGTANGQAS
ncbi:MAG: nicotinate (nicotinamide) nucleotide adenylyltransferase [Candidatus Eremiobacteraeota bacterium]|nr:nicotinate (nicotinamide) nucleotide adenylyltransferase [Candidatus Eremiobacteraeota bacterium]MBV9277650.1 nicotinate (nicotinamide) nucleotide adenylyltransferase [Candidatus Eremiobacteraeota bacterium]